MAKLKDGFYKLTAEAVGSNSYILLAGGGSKALSDFATVSGVSDSLKSYVTLSTNLTITGSKTFTASTNTFSGTGASILTVDRNSTNPAWIRFCKNGTLQGYIGITNDFQPVFLSGEAGSSNKTLLHAGNYTAYVNTTNFPGLNSVGDITGVTAGNGLTGGATSGTATLNVGAGTGITVNANDIAVKYGNTAGTACQGNDSRLSNARVNPNKLTIFGVEYDGSNEKTVTASTMIATLSEGTSNVTDNTEILTSYASNNGFADSNAPNVLYKRDAVCLYNYINTKLAGAHAGLDKVGTVTSVTVTGANGLSGSGTVTTSGTITLSNAGVRSTTIHGNYLRVNTNGTNADLTIPYATNADKVDGLHAQFNKLYYTSKSVTMSTVLKEWYIKIVLSAYAQPTLILISGYYNNQVDRAIIEMSGMSRGYIYRNVNQNGGNIQAICYKTSYDETEKKWIFWVKLRQIDNRSSHYSPASSATYTVYLSDNFDTFNVTATTTAPTDVTWDSVNSTNTAITLKNATLHGNADSATTASKLGSSTLGSTYEPIYLSSGTATKGTSYAKAIKGITRSGTTFTYTCIDGTTGTFTLLDNNSDTKVTQTVTSSNATYPLLLAPSGQTATTTTTSYFDSGVTLNPSTNTITANITGSAGSVAWGNVTGKPSSYTPSAHDHTRILFIDDRDTVETPTDVANKNGIEIHFKNKLKSNVPSTGAWTAVVMLDGYSDTSGGYPMELGFSMSDLSESRPLYLRTPKSATEWGGWRTVLDSNTYKDFINTTNFAGLHKTGTVTSVTITQGTGITVSNSGTAITSSGTRTITLNSASSSAIGGILLGYSASGANIPLQTSSNKGYVALTKAAVVAALGYTPPTSDTNTTYSFTGGVDKFTVTPSSGSAVDVGVQTLLVNGTYTRNGGEQRPNYVGSGKVRWNMMRSTTTYYDVAAFSGYCDWMMMDTYTGGDVPYVTMIGVLKDATPHAYIASGAKGSSTGKWTIKTLLDSANSSVSKSGQTLTVKINGVEQSLTNTTYTSLKNPNAIKFKNTAGTTVTYDGSSAADLTGGVNYATTAGSANSVAWGNITGKPSTFTPSSHNHSQVLDISSSSATTFAYSKARLNYGDYTWLAGWNGYELRAVNKNQFALASHTHSYITSGGRLTCGTTTARATGLRLYEIYNNGYPFTYGNVILFNGASGVGLLACQWHGTGLAYRSAPDTSTTFTGWATILTSTNSSVSGGGSSGGSSITVNIGGTSKTLTIPTSLPANGGNADTVDNLHASAFMLHRGWWGSDKTYSADGIATGMYFAYANHGVPNHWGTLVTFAYQESSSYNLQLHGTGDNYLYYRNRSADYGLKPWKRLADADELKNPADYYWANVKISSSSNKATTPTFSTIATTGVSYVATLRPSTTETHYLGSANNRWNNVFSKLGNFSGQIISSVATGTSPFKITSTTVNTNLNADMVDGKHASDFATSSHSHAYLPLAGGTMTGNIKVYTDGDGRGLKFGTSTLNSLSNQLLWQSGEAIRFGSSSWDWDAWAGLKYKPSSKIIYLGLADGTIFNANTALSGGKLYLPGISEVYTGNGTNKVWHAGNDGSGSGLNADMVDGYNIWVGTRGLLPGTKVNNTIYIII